MHRGTTSSGRYLTHLPGTKGTQSGPITEGKEVYVVFKQLGAPQFTEEFVGIFSTRKLAEDYCTLHTWRNLYIEEVQVDFRVYYGDKPHAA